MVSQKNLNIDNFLYFCSAQNLPKIAQAKKIVQNTGFLGRSAQSWQPWFFCKLQRHRHFSELSKKSLTTRPKKTGLWFKIHSKKNFFEKKFQRINYWTVFNAVQCGKSPKMCKKCKNQKSETSGTKDNLENMQFTIFNLQI